MFTRNRKFLHLHHNCVALELVTSLWLKKLKSSNSAKIPLDIFFYFLESLKSSKMSSGFDYFVTIYDH